MLSDTWEYDGIVWVRRQMSGPPYPRLWAGMAYDTRMRLTVLFAGTNYGRDTWTWDGSAWSLLPINRPPFRYGHGMAYDASRQTIVVFGGSDLFSTQLGDTWELGPWCLANCDGSTTPPVLNVGDFVCFQQRFAAGDSYANCDASSTPPVLNIADFVCFQQRFAAGCP